MRRAKTEKTREQLISNSRRMAKRGGFTAAAVDTLMATVWMTGSAFYRYFVSKDQLFDELLERELADSVHMLGGDVDDDTPPGEFARRLHAYLGMEHVAHPETGCVLPAMGSELGRADARIRRGVERSLGKLEAALRAQLGDRGDEAWALIAQCVGTVVIARAIESTRGRRSLLASSKRSVDRTLAAKPRRRRRAH